MNNQEAIKELAYIKIKLKEANIFISPSMDIAMNMATEALQFQDIMVNNPKSAKPTPEVCKNCMDNKQDNWIPVSKRLPTKDEINKDNRFLVTQNNNSIGVCVFNYDGTSTSKEYWKKNVVAWQSLPEPYGINIKGEKK